MREPRMIFGFCLLLIIAFLSARVALGKVEQATSYGLDILLGSLATLSGAFAQWCFSAADKKQESSKDNAITK
jgi:hypothetical protein